MVLLAHANHQIAKLSNYQIKPMAIQLHQIRIELDYLWSIRLGACLRIMSVDKPYNYNYAITDTLRRLEYNKIIPCAPGQLVLCNPDVNGNSKFWTMDKKIVQDQINQGKLIFNTIPSNWSRLKYEANKVDEVI